jgi:glycogen debranching enzyme
MKAARRPARAHPTFLHDLVTVVSAPALALSTPDGQIVPTGAAGFYLADRRALSRLVVTVDGQLPESVRGQNTGDATARFVGVVRDVGDEGPDPTVLVERLRTVSAVGLREIVTVVSHARAPVACTVGVDLGCDLADVGQVRTGRISTELPADRQPGSVCWRGPDGVAVVTTPTPAADAVTPAGRLEWAVSVEPGERWMLTLDVAVTDDQPPPVIVAPTRRVGSVPELSAGDHRLPALVRQSVADLHGLLLADPQAPDDNFLAAGAPWYLTLFGRDSIWAARMALPLGTQLAGGTLRTLARRQGRHRDAETGEAPGKILHELRRATSHHGPGTHAALPLTLPALYYGTVDATPLWILLLHDAWRWGLPEAEVAALLPHLDAALGWLRDDAVDDTGFVRYIDESGRGLTNQGWKDSGDAIQFANGTVAQPPIALCEVQGYAHAAARRAADLLDAFDRPGGSGWRGWAEELRARFRDRFWIDDAEGGYPAIALDGSGRPVDTVTSNIGHLLGTGLLDGDESDRVVRRLAAPDMDCGFGLRTLSSCSAGFNPLSYHAGSVWAHDTAIAIQGLVTVGTDAAQRAAASLIDGLLAAAPAFGFRLPELHGGESDGRGRLPLPYPAACRPQAWSAAAALVLVSVILGVSPDVPGGRLALRPLRPSPVGELTVHGLRVAGRPLDLHLSATGDLHVLAAPSELRIEVSVQE